MNPKRKAAQVDRLATAIGYIGPNFERFGGAFLDELLATPLGHPGLNLLGYPVATVADTTSDDGRIVAEYSDQAGYFERPMSKAGSDLDHALLRRPGARDVFLLSGSRKRPQIAQEFETKALARSEMAGKSLHLWGAEDIAERLLGELIFSDTAVRRLAAHLPELLRIRDEEATSRLVPAPDPGRLRRPEVDAELSRRLGGSRVVTVSGVGGVGKSAAAAAYAADHADDYDLAIWLDQGELRRPEDLQALPLVRGGEQRNVANLLRVRACLLVIDDAGDDFGEDGLAALCGPGSRVIVTRRSAPPSSYLLPMLDEAEGRTLLERGGGPCPDGSFARIWSTVGGHPLALRMIGAAAREGATWGDLELDCREVGEIEGGGVKLADKLLGRLRPTLQRELSVFAWAGQPNCGEDFFKAVALPLGLRKLREHGLTAADRSGTLRLHDVVFAALSVDWCGPGRAAELDAALESYLREAAGQPGLQLWTAARILRAKLEKLVGDGNRSPALLYALLIAWEPDELDPRLVGDPLAEADALTGKAPEPMAVITVIEAVEHLFFHDKIEGDVAAKAKLRGRLSVFGKLAALPGLGDRQLAEIHHHEAKALKRLGETDAAARLFEEVMRGPYPLHEARLQLIDIYRSEGGKADRVVELVDQVLGTGGSGREVSYSVMLGVIERLPWGTGGWRSDLIRRHAEAIERTIVEAGNVGVRQALAAFAMLGRYISKEEPDMFGRILSRLPEPSPADLSGDDDLFAWAEVFAEAARLEGADAAGLRAKALTLYEAEARPQRFHEQRRAELLIDMGRPGEGEALLHRRADLCSNPWLQRLMARARLAQGDAREALNLIDKAIGGLKAPHFMSEFLEHRHDARAALGDPGARDDLVAARAASVRDQEKARLDARLGSMAP